MTEQKQNKPMFIEKLAEALSRLSAADAEKLEIEGYELELRVKKSRVQKAKPASATLPDEQIAAVREQLLEADSRERARELIQTLDKATLFRLLRDLDVPCQKKDPLDVLREKIIENTVGFKLRSEVIREGQG